MLAFTIGAIVARAIVGHSTEEIATNDYQSFSFTNKCLKDLKVLGKSVGG